MRSKQAIVSIFILMLSQSRGHPNPDTEPERSLLDSGFSRTANYLMKTAMKLPPHILPTLDELVVPANSGKEIGVYVPGHKDIGVYLPKLHPEGPKTLGHLDNFYEEEQEQPEKSDEDLSGLNEQVRTSVQTARRRTRGRRPKMGRRRRRRKHSRGHRLPALPFDPKSPVKFAPNLGSRVNPFNDKFRPHRRRPILTPDSIENQLRLRREKKVKPEGHPYDFTKPLNSNEVSGESAEASARLGSSKKRSSKKGAKAKTLGSKYVPNMVKEILAKTFLKNPDAYIDKLRKVSSGEIDLDEEEAAPYYKTPKSAPTLPPIRPKFTSRPKLVGSGVHSGIFDPNNFALANENRNYFFKNNFDSHLPVPKVHHLQAWKDPKVRNAISMVNNNNKLSKGIPFEEYYDLNDNANDLSSLYKYNLDYGTDVDYLSPDFDDATPHPTQAPLMSRNNYDTISKNRICICCDETSSHRHFNNHVYSRRTLKVGSDEELQDLLAERALIEEELDCSQQEPIEVVLVFESQKLEGPRRQVNGRFQGAQSQIQLTPTRPTTFDGGRRPSLFKRERPPPAPYDKKFQRNPLERYHDVYYDPTKLSFIFSTPSPLRKKYIELRDRRAMEGGDGDFISQPKGRNGVSNNRDNKAGSSQEVYFPSSSEIIPTLVKSPLTQQQRAIQRSSSPTISKVPKNLRDVYFG